MSSIEFLHSVGWACIIAYCLNNLGLVPPTWVSAAQSTLGIATPAQIEVSPMASPSSTPSIEVSPNAETQP